jgi:hypothetical protein
MAGMPNGVVDSNKPARCITRVMIPFGFVEYASMGWRINFTCCLFLSNGVWLGGAPSFASVMLEIGGVWGPGFCSLTKGALGTRIQLDSQNDRHGFLV